MQGWAAAWMAGTSPAMTLVCPRAQGARCGNIGRALGSFSNGMLPRGIPLIPLNPGESRFRISVSRNPVFVSGWFSDRPCSRAVMPGLVPGIHGFFRVRRVLLREMPGTSPGMTAWGNGRVSGYPRVRHPPSCQARPGCTRGWRDGRIPGSSPGMPGHDVIGGTVNERCGFGTGRYINPRIASTMRSWEGMTSSSRRSL